MKVTFVESNFKMMRPSYSVDFGQMSAVIMGSCGVGEVDRKI